MLHRKAKEGETVVGKRGGDTFSIVLRRIGRGSALLEIDAPDWSITFEPADGLDDATSDLTSVPRSD